MRITLLAFATAAEALGAREKELELPADATVDDLRLALAERHPALADLWPRLAVAVDGEVATATATIPDGAEVALLPPVSGGAPPRACLTDRPIDLAAITAVVADPGHGATVLFLGSVRDHHGGRGVAAITYDAYREMAGATLARLVDELEAETGDLRLAVTHRLGRLEVGETSVAIAASSPHREAAYAACRELLERLKRRVPIWKREHYVDGTSSWREEEPLTSEVRRSGE